MSKPMRGGRALGAVLPGAPQLLAGRWGSGVAALLVWAGCLWLGAVRAGHLPAALTGRADERIAVLTLVAALLLAWTWSWRDVARKGAPEPWLPPWVVAGGRAFAQNRAAVTGAIALLAIVLVSLLAPLVTLADPVAQPADLTANDLLPLSAEHWLGTDHLGRDVFTRLVYGARISLAVGIIATTIAVVIGTLFGAVSGFLGGRVDTLMMGFVDVVISFPRLILLLTIVAFFDRSFALVTVVLGLTLWPGTARLVRGEVLSLRERDFVVAARGLGYSGGRIVVRHLVPNALAPVIVAATLGIGNTIILEAGLSFLGLGMQSTTPSWGGMVSDGHSHLLSAPWLSTFPGLAIVVTVLSFNLVGDGLRDALDPRMRS